MQNKAHLTEEGLKEILAIKKANEQGKNRTVDNKGESLTSCSRDYRTVKPGGYNKSSLPKIKREDYEILYGLILGDLIYQEKILKILRFEQSVIHKDYLKHLFNKFSNLGTSTVSIKVAARKLFNTSSVYFVTRQSTAIQTSYFILP